MKINQEPEWQKRLKYLHEMHKTGTKLPKGQWDAISDELSLREMSTMSSYEEKGVDTTIIIGDEEPLSSLVPDVNLQSNSFTARGKLGQGRLTRLLKTLTEKYKVKIQISCQRRVR